jgi:Uma2 family endonuclease
MTTEQYSHFERAQEFRHHFQNPELYRADESPFGHAIIVNNLASVLAARLDKVYIVHSRDLRVGRADQVSTGPDIFIVSGEPDFGSDREDTVLNPAVIIEVMSHGSEAADRGSKFQQYRLIESLVEYVLVAQYKPRVEVFRRQSEDSWMLITSEGMEGACLFESVDCLVDLAEIYRKIVRI